MRPLAVILSSPTRTSLSIALEMLLRRTPCFSKSDLRDRHGGNARSRGGAGFCRRCGSACTYICYGSPTHRRRASMSNTSPRFRGQCGLVEAALVQFNARPDLARKRIPSWMHCRQPLISDASAAATSGSVFSIIASSQVFFQLSLSL
jgi:hypothetical protein